MDWTLVLGVVVVGLLVAVIAFLWRLVHSPLPAEMQEAFEKKTDAKLGVLKEEWSKRLSEELQKTWDQIQGQVRTTESSVSQKLETANQTYAQVKEELGRLKAATDQVESVGRNVATLQELLRSPKMRGGIGEFFLADLLKQILPASGNFYTLQYEFEGSDIVDAVIRLQGRLVPVDSKFPLESFQRITGAVTDAEQLKARKELNREVKKHIDVIAEKYIRPSEGTFDFALMYIPAENVYYETIIKQEGIPEEDGVFQHAVSKQVIPVSPNSFYAYLQVILLGLRGLTVESKAQEILESLIKLQKDLGQVREDFDLTGKQLRFALNNFEKADRHLGRFEDRVNTVEDQTGSDALLLPSEDISIAKEN